MTQRNVHSGEERGETDAFAGYTVLNFIYIFFKKWGALAPPAPSPCGGPGRVKLPFHYLK